MMATTNLIALHAGRDGSIHKALMRTIGYVENPEKTESGTLVISYQCDPRTAAAEFFWISGPIELTPAGRTEKTM